MNRSSDLFPGLPKIRKKPRILMHYTDVGINDCAGDPIVAATKCDRCGHESNWQTFRTATQVKRGIPCPNCNSNNQ